MMRTEKDRPVPSHASRKRQCLCTRVGISGQATLPMPGIPLDRLWGAFDSAMGQKYVLKDVCPRPVVVDRAIERNVEAGCSSLVSLRTLQQMPHGGRVLCRLPGLGETKYATNSTCRSRARACGTDRRMSGSIRIIGIQDAPRSWEVAGCALAASHHRAGLSAHAIRCPRSDDDDAGRSQ